MPRPAQQANRQRIVYCDCRDCRDLPLDVGEELTDEAQQVALSVARQVPHPPKALVIYASGMLVRLQACQFCLCAYTHICSDAHRDTHTHTHTHTHTRTHTHTHAHTHTHDIYVHTHIHTYT